jgi:hypothetical protein
VDVSAVSSTLNNGVGATGQGFKVNPIGIGSYVRLYPGFDGLAANGLRYGAAVELRENFQSGVTTSGTAASPSANTSAETIYVRRAFTYLASDQVGLVRLGQTDGVLGLFDNCVFTSQCWDAGSGVFNGGVMQQSSPSGIWPPFVWLDQSGAEYGNNKVVYLSPQFYGFDFGVQYAPNMGNSFQNASTASAFQAATCTQASAGCVGLTSGNDATRWYNQVGLGLRYQQTFGAVDFKTYGFWETAGQENLTTGPHTLPNPTGSAATLATLRYDNLNFYKAGVAVTAFNTTLAVDYIGGAVNGQLAMKPTGGANMNAVLAGLTYANGPFVLGIDFGTIQSQGDARLTGISQRHEYEIGFGGNYKLAPGVQLVGEYQYAYRHQGGFNFNTGTPGVTKDAQGQGVTFATVLTW